MERQEPRETVQPETPPTPEKHAYEPPKIEAVRLSSEAAESLT